MNYSNTLSESAVNTVEPRVMQVSTMRSLLLRKSIFNVFLTILGKTPAALVPFLIAFWFGISAFTDIYFLIFSVVVFVAHFISGSVRPIIVPFISELRSKGQMPNTFVSNALLLTLSLSVIVGLAYAAIGPFFIGFISAVDPQYDSPVKILSWELSLLIPVMACNSLLGGSLNAYQRFYVVTALPFVCYTTVILSMFFGKDHIGIHSVCLGHVLGQVLVAFILLRRVRSVIGRFIFSRRFVTDQTIRFLKVVFFQSLAIVVWSVNPVVDNIMVSYLGLGNISRLEYAYKLVHVPLALFSSGVVVVFFSYFSRIYHEKGLHVLRHCIMRILYILVPSSILLAVLLWFGAHFLIEFVYGSNETLAVSLVEITAIFRYCCFMLVPHLVGLVFVRYYMIIRRTQYILHTSLISFAANIVFNYILMQRLGSKGIALSTTCVMTLQCMVLVLIYLRKSPSAAHSCKEQG